MGRLSCVCLFAGLLLTSVIVVERSLAEFRKVPFTCSYLPGRSHINVAFLLWIYLLLTGIVGAAVGELQALQRPTAFAAVLSALGVAALGAVLRNNWLARPALAELRFEEEPPDRLLTLDLSWDGGALRPVSGSLHPGVDRLSDV